MPESAALAARRAPETLQDTPDALRALDIR